MGLHKLYTRIVATFRWLGAIGQHLGRYLEVFKKK